MNLTTLILIKKTINTFLTPKIKFFYYNYDKKFIKNKKNRIIFNILGRIWFIPINIMSRYWHNIIEGDNHNYKKYNKIDKSAQILLKKVIKFLGLFSIPPPVSNIFSFSLIIWIY